MSAATRRSRLVLCALLLAPVLAATGPRAQIPYRILITNDDGIGSPGIAAVVSALAPDGEVTVVAPAQNQSAKGHSITIGEPIYVDEVDVAGGRRGYAVGATPATCVKVAVLALMPERPDLVVSGINHGNNLGMVTYVSGTVAAAREAALMGIPAVAASLASAERDYAPAAAIVKQVVAMVRRNGLPTGSFLNVNVPAGTAGAIKGIQLTTQSAASGSERFEEQKTPWGRRYFWDVWNEPTDEREGTDVWATAHGYAAVTPLSAGEFDARTYEDWRARLTPGK